MKKGLATRKDEKDNHTATKKNIANEIEIEIVKKKKWKMRKGEGFRV
jgi:hypothetical protein